MELNRTFNAKRNFIWSLGNRFLSLILPFVNRTVFINVLGVEYLGLNSFCASILQVLSLSELGIGSAIVYHMYKPIAENDTEKVCALLALYRRIYRWIGWAVLLIGLLVMPFLSNMITGDMPDNINLFLIYLLYLFNTVISYWGYVYKSSIANAMQRLDIIANVNSITQLFLFLGQICVLYATENYYFYIAIMLVATFLNNILLSKVIEKNFPQYKCYGQVPRIIIQDIKGKVLGLFIQRCCSTTRNALDSICLSYFLGLSIVGVYNNYYYVMIAATSILGIACSAIAAGVGNSMVLNDVRKNYNDMRRLNFIYMIFSGISTSILLNLYQPFICIWLGKSFMLPFSTVILISVYFYVLKMGDVRSVYVSGAGLWWESRYRAIVETICNLILNVILGKYYGVNGIVAATLISLFCVNFCWGSRIVFRYYFSSIKIDEYFIDHCKVILVTVVLTTVSYLFCAIPNCDGYLRLAFNFLATGFVMVVGNWLVFHRTALYYDSKSWLISRIKIKHN